jgi:hypothetical protein
VNGGINGRPEERTGMTIINWFLGRSSKRPGTIQERIHKVDEQMRKEYYFLQEQEHKRFLQDMEDSKIQRAIRLEAERLAGEYRAALVYPGIGKLYIPVANPRIYQITIWDEATARYKGQDIIKLIYEEYKRLIREDLP